MMPLGVKVKQVFMVEDDYIHALGTDDNMYFWSSEEGDWFLNSDKE